MIGFILAAGFGTRLRPLTNHLPKALVPVGGWPLLHHALTRQARASGTEAMLVNSHYLPEAIERYRDTTPFQFAINHEPEIRGTGGALVAARHILLDHPLTCVTNVDILCQVDLDGLAASFLASGAEVGLVADLADDDSGTIWYDPATLRYRGVPAEAERPSGAASAHYIGIAFYTPAFIRRLTDDDFSVVPAWSRAETAVVPLPPQTYWRDIGTPAALLQAHRDLLAGRLEVMLPSELVLDPDIPCCYHREGAVPGPNAWVETPLPDGCELQDCLVLPGTELTPDHAFAQTILTPWGKLHVDG